GWAERTATVEKGATSESATPARRSPHPLDDTRSRCNLMGFTHSRLHAILLARSHSARLRPGDKPVSYPHRTRSAAQRAALFFFVAGLLAIVNSLLLESARAQQAFFIHLAAL